MRQEGETHATLQNLDMQGGIDLTASRESVWKKLRDRKCHFQYDKDLSLVEIKG